MDVHLQGCSSALSMSFPLSVSTFSTSALVFKHNPFSVVGKESENRAGACGKMLLVQDCASIAVWCEWNSSTALHWNERFAFSALFVSQSFEVGFVLCAGCIRTGCWLVSGALTVLQWVKKLSQCLAVLERSYCNKSSQIYKNVKIIYVIESHLGFRTSPNICDLKQNWWTVNQNKMAHDWDHFFTLYYWSYQCNKYTLWSFMILFSTSDCLNPF